MKKSIIILCAVLITLSLTAFGVINWNDTKTEEPETIENKEIAINTITEEKANTDANYVPVFGPFLEKHIEKPAEDYNYAVGPRFGAIKKSTLNNAKSIEDFLDAEEMQFIEYLESVTIIIIKNDIQTDIREIGYSDTLTEAQLQLLQSSSYDHHFLIRADFKQKNEQTGKLEDSYFSPHLTIVPEKQAEYIDGKENFMRFFKENSKEAREKSNVDMNKMKAAKLYFTVTKKGDIENIWLDRSSNYPLIDENMIELVNKLPGTWKPAENEKGEKVDQELVISFGLIGC